MDKEKHYEDKLVAEVNSPSNFQKELHGIIDEENSTQVFVKTHYNPSFSSIFYFDEQITTDGGCLSYTYQNKYDYLVKNTIIQPLPELRIKKDVQDKFKVRWTENISNHILPSGILDINNGKVKNTMDEIFLDGYDKIRKDKNINKLTEKHIKSQEWSTYIPKSTLFIKYPWFFNKSESHAFPFLGQKITIKNKYQYRNKLSSLIQVIKITKNDDGTEDNILLNENQISKLLTTIFDFPKDSEYSKLPIPYVKSIYSIATDDEREDMLKEIKEKGFTIYYEDVENIDSSNEISLDTETTLTFNSSKPINKVIYMARNINCISNNYYSNYTSDMFDSKNGFDIIEKRRVMKNENLRVPEASNHETGRLFPDLFGYNVPDTYGYHYDFYGIDSDELIPYGVFFGKCDYIISLKDCNPYILKDKSEEIDIEKICEQNTPIKTQPNLKYKLYLRFVIIKSFKIIEKESNIEIDVTNYSEDTSIL